MTAGLVLQVSENNSDEIRIGLTASKKVGNAVTRNLIKRRFRAISRDVTNKFKSGHDYVILARKSSSTREFDKLKKDLLYALYQ